MGIKTIAWNSGGGYIRLTYSGSGNGTISVESDANTIGTSRSQTITVQTVGGAVTKNLTVSQAACPFPVGDIKNYSYTGSYQQVELPAGKYKLQVWGAQGGADGYGYTNGGKGGYSEGVITLVSKTTVRVYVGGQGSYNSGGYNGGGSTSRYSSYSSGDTYGYSYMGGGGGATDIRLSDGALLSRMIVAGGGSGGAYTYREETVTHTDTESMSSSEVASLPTDWRIGGDGYYYYLPSSPEWNFHIIDLSSYSDWDITVNYAISGSLVRLQDEYPVEGRIATSDYDSLSSGVSTPINGRRYLLVQYMAGSGNYNNASITFTKTSTTTQSSSDYQSGYAGGGTNGIGYSSSYYGKQNGAGSGGSFGQGANQTTSNYRHCSGAGGGGWYGGGGGQYSDNDMNTVHLSGGGSGFVNTSASAGNRPSGYTGLELDSGTLYAGNQSFPAPSGGNETGHSGNGYARITRLE